MFTIFYTDYNLYYPQTFERPSSSYLHSHLLISSVCLLTILFCFS